MAGLLLQLRNLRSKEGKVTLQRPQQSVPESGGNLDLVLHGRRGQVEDWRCSSAGRMLA